MKSVSRIALGAALALGGSAVLLTSPADAQRRQRTAQPAVPAGPRPLNLTNAERPALVALEAAARGTDRAAQDAALAAARAAVTSADGRYAMARYQLLIAEGRSDRAMMAQALDVVLESPSLPPEDLPVLLTAQSRLALDDRNYAKAERALNRLVQLQPNNADHLGNLALVRIQQGNRAEGFRDLQRAIASRQAAGQQVPESWLQYALRETFDSRDAAVRAQSRGFARALVTSYATPVNWRNALIAYRETAEIDAAT